MMLGSYVVACADSHALERSSKGGRPNGYGVDDFSQPRGQSTC